MAIKQSFICSSHTISGVVPGDELISRHGFEDRVSACASAGYTGMCLHFKDYRKLRAEGYSDQQLGAILRQHKMTDIGVEFLVDWFLDASPTTAARNDEQTAFAAARAYGARVLNVGSDFQNRGIAREVMRARFRDLCQRAAHQGLKIALEIVPWSDVPDVATALQMIEGIDNAGLVVDSWHVFRGGISLDEVAHIPGDRIFDIQINDADAQIRGTLMQDTMCRKPCGEGVFDLEGFLKALDRAGANVPLSVEIISADFAALDVAEAASQSIAGARALMARG